MMETTSVRRTGRLVGSLIGALLTMSLLGSCTLVDYMTVNLAGANDRYGENPQQRRANTSTARDAVDDGDPFAMATQEACMDTEGRVDSFDVLDGQWRNGLQYNRAFVMTKVQGNCMQLNMVFAKGVLEPGDGTCDGGPDSTDCFAGKLTNDGSDNEDRFIGSEAIE